MNESVTLPAQGSGYRFQDVEAGTWYYEAVEAMAAEGKGSADQRIAIARGIKDSIDVIQGSTMTAEEAKEYGLIDIVVDKRI